MLDLKILEITVSMNHKTRLNILLTLYITILDMTDSQEKLYFISKNFHMNWINSKSFCSSFGMDLVAIESSHEEQYFLKSCERDSKSFEELTSIGATSELTHEKEKWFLTTTGSEINYNLNLMEDENNKGRCLALVKTNEKFSYQRIECNGSDKHQFICQKLIPQTENWLDIFMR